MVKAIYFFQRKPGLPVEDFQQYWRTIHADLVRRIGGITRYAQCHTLLSGYRRPKPPVLDGVEEVCFHSPEVLTLMGQAAAGQAAMADLGNFVDLQRLKYIVTEEVEIKPGDIHEGMVKSIELVTRKKGMPPTEFHAYWRDFHGPLAARIGQIKRYVQSHTLISEYDKKDPPDYDGVAETWFTDTGAMRQSASTAEYAATRGDEKNFLTEPLPFIITKELKII